MAWTLNLCGIIAQMILDGKSLLITTGIFSIWFLYKTLWFDRKTGDRHRVWIMLKIRWSKARSSRKDRAIFIRSEEARDILEEKCRNAQVKDDFQIEFFLWFIIYKSLTVEFEIFTSIQLIMTIQIWICVQGNIVSFKSNRLKEIFVIKPF